MLMWSLPFTAASHRRPLKVRSKFSSNCQIISAQARRPPLDASVIMAVYHLPPLRRMHWSEKVHCGISSHSKYFFILQTVRGPPTPTTHIASFRRVDWRHDCPLFGQNDKPPWHGSLLHWAADLSAKTTVRDICHIDLGNQIRLPMFTKILLHQLPQTTRSTPRLVGRPLWVPSTLWS